MPDETITPQAIGAVLAGIAGRANEELFAMTGEQLKADWHFQWSSQSSVDWNLYKFSDYLEMYKRRCRRWEEHHNGSACVVERVRDTYLMPRIKEFQYQMQAHLAAIQKEEKA